ncbi:Beta-L-arabinobiosidase [Cytospora mali]|uniref:Beta-L-arabinobiosidase n=1 Tax=Cytospora mali TaxID=578113 RepID=A0A194V2B9_CYTMA|nr:Beta-L-arabinobiosidase [Valsa mali var. pyri (nom. inval.)]
MAHIIMGTISNVALQLSLVQANLLRPYPPVDAHLQSINFLDHEAYLKDLDDHQWYLDNIPFIDVPDKSMQEVYYYRTSVIKRHVKWAHEGHGWVVTEFIHPVSWASKFQTIPDSAPHHLVELRWLRDPNYVKDVIQLYTRAGAEAITGITYTHYMHRAILEVAEATGDIPFLVSQLDGMIAMYNLWNSTRDNTTGLYHRNPLQDAQEYSLPGYLVGGPDGGPMQEWNDFGLSLSTNSGNDYSLIWVGPETYRPSMNAYMVANAWAIGTVAGLAGDKDLNFWIDVVEGNNLPCEGRELIGYYPYRFDIGTNQTYIDGLAAALDDEHFLTEFGPTTLEQTNPYYTALKNTTYCCIWNGQSWPFSTSVYLGTLARIARDALSDVITSELFNQELKKYTRTNYKNGVPFTAESHYPIVDEWSGDTTNHSEHYLHSTYLDNIFTNLFGIAPTFGDILVLQPLVPSNWSYFVIENLPYHGTLLTMVWDQDGTHYGNGSVAGLTIYSNGTLFHHQTSLGPVNVTLPFNTTVAVQTLASQPEWQNILANPNYWALNPNGDTALYQPWKMNDGLLWYDTTPDNFWTNNQSEVPYSTINITLPRARQMTSISLGILDDTDVGGVAACPAGIRVTDGRTGNVVVYENPWTDCVPNALNTVSFADISRNGSSSSIGSYSNSTGGGSTVETDLLQVTLSDKLRYTTAVSEIQIWVPPNTGPRYEAEDGVMGTFIGSFEGRATGLNGTIENGGVTLGSDGWVELADVRREDGSAGSTTLTVIGGGTGSIVVQLNWLANQTATFSGDVVENKTLTVDMLRGGNVVTIFQTNGSPWIDAIVVGD